MKSRWGTGGVIAWLRVKLAEAEQALRTREQMAECCERSGDPKYWEELANSPGVRITTKTCRGQKAPTVKGLLQEGKTQRRIALKCRRDVEMLRHLLAALGSTVQTK